jgi:FixJ family two-component response regulator
VATRLLVADDDADMRQSMRLLLQRAGYGAQRGRAAARAGGG